MRPDLSINVEILMIELEDEFYKDFGNKGRKPNVECLNCRLSHFEEVVKDLGYCIRCGSDFQVTKSKSNAILPTGGLPALSTLSTLSSEIPNAVNAVNVGKGGICE